MSDDTQPAADVAPDSTAPTTVDAPQASRPRARIVALGIVSALIATVVGLAAAEHGHDSSTTTPPDATPTVANLSLGELATVGTKVAALLSYSPTTVATDLPAEGAYLTGPFKAQYTKLVQSVIAPGAKKDKVTTRAKIVDSGVESSKGDTVTTLFFVDVTTTSTMLPEPRVSGSRLKVTLQRVGDDWLITGLDPI